MGVARWWSSRHPADTRLGTSDNGGITPRKTQATSEEQLKAFLEAVKADAGLQEKLKAAADVDAVVAIAKAAGFVISVEELKKPQNLSDEELESVAGGNCGGCASLDVPTNIIGRFFGGVGKGVRDVASVVIKVGEAMPKIDLLQKG